MENQKKKRLTIPHIVALVLIIVLLYFLSARTTVYFYDPNEPVLRQAAFTAECSTSACIQGLEEWPSHNIETETSQELSKTLQWGSTGDKKTERLCG